MQEAETTGGQLRASFTHGSDGEKLSAKSGNNGFEYLGSLIYVRRSGKLSFEQALFDEGAVKISGPEYFIKDHLGSVRVIVNKAGKVLEQNDYYPFGGRHGNSSLAVSATNRYKFSGKESLEPFDIGLLDFGARFYDARLARWSTQDPLSDSYLSLSPYGYCSGNPVSRIDPSGMADDWVERFDEKQNKMRLVFDPNVTSAGDPDLKPLDRYMGESFETHDRNGNVTANYRKDGSILYANEADAHRRIVEQSQSTGNEGFFAMTDQGHLVLPDYKNSSKEVDIVGYGYKFNNGNIVDPEGKTYKTFGTVHTHPDGSEPSRDAISNYGDLAFGAYHTPNKPVYVLRLNGKNQVGFIVAHPNPSHDPKAFRYQVVKLIGNDSQSNITNVVKGRFSLMDYTNQNQYILKNF